MFTLFIVFLSFLCILIYFYKRNCHVSSWKYCEVINDPLGQPTVPAGSDCRMIMKFWDGRTDGHTYGRTDTLCENSDLYRPGLWSASWINNKDKGTVTWSLFSLLSSVSNKTNFELKQCSLLAGGIVDLAEWIMHGRHLFCNNFWLQKKKFLLPGPTVPSLPIIGQSYLLIGDPYRKIVKMSQRYLKVKKLI